MLTWGDDNSNGQLGHGNTNAYQTPTLVEALKDKVIVKVAAGGARSMALTGNI